MSWIGSRRDAASNRRTSYIARDHAAHRREYGLLTAIIYANLHPLTS
jgi:hypothetical protein